MQRAALLLLLLVAFVRCAPGGAVQREVSELPMGLVNGNRVAPGKFPSQVSVQLNRMHICGGSIVNQDWVLTAAHCLDYWSYKPMEVLAGTINLSEGGTRHTVIEINAHVDYDPNDSWINDIAVLKVSPSFPIDGVTVAPVQLPAQGEQVPDGADVTVIGWGDLWYKGMSTDRLLKVDIDIINQQQCEALWNAQGYPIYPTQICAARFKYLNYGSCQGDSGGPLLYEGRIVGLVSWGFRCATPPFPTIYTRVSSYVDWINERTSG